MGNSVGIWGYSKKWMEFTPWWLWSLVRICDMERSPCYKNSTSSSMGRGFHSCVRLPVAGNKKCWVYPSTSSHLVAGILPLDTIHPFRWAQFDGSKKPRNPPLSHHQYRFHLALPNKMRITPNPWCSKWWSKKCWKTISNSWSPPPHQTQRFPAKAKSPQGRRSRRMGLFASWGVFESSSKLHVVFFSIFVWVFSSNGYIGYTSGKLT